MQQDKVKPVIDYKSTRLLSQGGMPNSAGGIYNPGAVLCEDGVIYILCRRDPAYVTKIEDFHLIPSYPTLLIQCPATDKILDNYTLEPVGFTEQFGLRYRIEDFRLFEWRGRSFCNHVVIYYNEHEELIIAQAISEVVPNLRILHFKVVPDLPVLKRNLEKNWMYFVQNDKLHCLYGMSPYKIFNRNEEFVPTNKPGFFTGVWTKAGPPVMNVKWHSNDYISSSANPIMVDDSLLVWFHSRDNKTVVYHNGAALINPNNFNIEYLTQEPILSGGKCEGKRAGVLYVSSCVYLEKRNLIRVYYGEGDSHSSYIDYNKDELLDKIRKEPFEI